MRTTTKTLVAATFAVIGGLAFADAKGDEIMNKVADFKKPSFSQSQVVMTLEDKNGTKEARQIVEYGKEEGGRTYVVMDSGRIYGECPTEQAGLTKAPSARAQRISGPARATPASAESSAWSRPSWSGLSRC